MIKFVTCKVWQIDIPSGVELIAYNMDMNVRCNQHDLDTNNQFHQRDDLLITFKVAVAQKRLSSKVFSFLAT